MVHIVQKENPVLRKKAQLVEPEKIGSRHIQKVLTDMSSALSVQKDGVAIAAPQIGVPLRIFVVSGKVFRKKETDPGIPDKIFINPHILKLSRDKEWLEEGCLSVRWLYGEIRRSKKALVQAYDEQGQKFTIGGSGLLAQIFQHEMDHLDGILFIDKARNLKEILPEDESVAT